MKLLVLAQIPPPIHGQSLMVQTLLDALPAAAPEIELHHVNLPLSRNNADVGRWRWGKLLPLAVAIWRVWRLTLRHGRMDLYYVPAPGKRVALYRDFLLLFFCRPLATRLILHWHATGLGHWLQHHAKPFERGLARRALGRAELSLVLGEALRADVAYLHPHRTVVIRNGIADPFPHWQRRDGPHQRPLHAVFVGACTRAKGVLAALAGVAEAHRRCPGSVRLTVAGDFDDPATAKAFRAHAARCGAPVDHIGFATAEAKHHLYAGADVLLFPTRYAAEAHPLVILEALAHDLPLILTDWHAVPEGLPPAHVHLIPARQRSAVNIADALERVAAAPRPAGAHRQYFLQHYTRDAFAHRLAEALR
ncbi:glycosyltransferase family 4 protein [Actomonas aquatica]|uniref:Glycosyltransferase family 4 protein n=1 Tax=Actomonas aquatica TaxID=2866162 RepID=A0ABZ1C4U0_9BACT|nr:glycosyltransferase family 4 protein [Opitutus sp. WL0086]WRQ86744.1 glycosyltransferase family 4 protein [Opitutus sp. WL0086]